MEQDHPWTQQLPLEIHLVHTNTPPTTPTSVNLFSQSICLEISPSNHKLIESCSPVSDLIAFESVSPPMKFLTSKQGAKLLLRLQGMHFPCKHIILEASLCLRPLMRSPLLIPIIKPLCLCEMPKAFFSILFHYP